VIKNQNIPPKNSPLGSVGVGLGEYDQKITHTYCDAGQPTTATMPSQWQLCNAKLSGVFDAQIPQLK